MKTVRPSHRYGTLARHILLIRHSEAEKNVAARFSSASDDELLTIAGEVAGAEVARAVAMLQSRMGWRADVHATCSRRAQLTAERIALEIGVTAQFHRDLRSIELGHGAGVTEQELARTSSAFIADLTLYRRGLLNAYDVRVPVGAEDHHAFERRVTGTIDKVLRESTAELLVFVLHRSSLTAALIEFARRYRNYPRSFYGYVPLELASISSVVLDRGILVAMHINESTRTFTARLLV